ncbi:MAG: N-acetylornithine carbamoyltransferase [Planctomycetota bacterium]|nr:N-acetylornithine carbamoyltransferase [Planctomycetota bacterium]
MIQGRDVVTLDTFSAEEIRHVTARARRMKAEGHGRPLVGRSLAMVFFDPSLRTRVSFDIAFSSLGGSVIDMAATRDLWPLAFGEGAVMDGLADEHVRDAAGVLSEYADLIAIRALDREGDWAQARQDLVIVSFQLHSSVPIFNMESVLDHPCQAFADALTLEEELGTLEGKKLALTWGWHPKARPLAVPHGVGLMASKLGMRTTIAHPEGYDLDGKTLATMRHAAAASGGSLDVVYDMDEALEQADVVYAASWGATRHHGRPDAEQAHRQPFRDWRLTTDRMAHTNGGRFMHAMPIRRNVEADDAVVDSAGSLIRRQAGNRLHVQRALFAEVLGA